jgi:hypothetical protein
MNVAMEKSDVVDKDRDARISTAQKTLLRIVLRVWEALLRVLMETFQDNRCPCDILTHNERVEA